MYEYVRMYGWMDGCIYACMYVYIYIIYNYLHFIHHVPCIWMGVSFEG